MKAIITVHIPKGAKVDVKEGDSVSYSAILAKTDKEEEMLLVDLAKPLGVQPVNVVKYLRKRVGDIVKEGEIIAFKKTIFSSTSIKSSVSGILESVDFKCGTVSILTKHTISQKIISPVAGKIASIKNQRIEIEAEAVVFEGFKGEGEKVRGTLRVFGEGEVGVMEGDTNKLSGSIVLSGSMTQAALVKYGVIGVNGFILLRVPSGIDLPYIQVEKEIFPKIAEHDGRIVVLDPPQKKVYLLH